MKTVGLLLLAAGFLGGSLVAVQTEANEVPWAYFVPALVVAVIGIVLSRLSDKQEAVASAGAGDGVRTLRESLERVVENIRRLDAERETLDPYEFHSRIDELFVEDLNSFADHRKQIGNTYGLQAYAEVMNEFAAGERYLNRVWSASVDGYVDEIQAYVVKARSQFEGTKRILDRLVQP